MTEPAVIHASRAELATELFWQLHIDPVARENGMKPPMQLLHPEPDLHLLEADDGTLLLMIRTDREDA